MIYLKLSAFVTLLPRNKILRGKHEKSCNSILKLISINRNTIYYFQKYDRLFTDYSAYTNVILFFLH